MGGKSGKATIRRGRDAPPPPPHPNPQPPRSPPPSRRRRPPWSRRFRPLRCPAPRNRSVPQAPHTMAIYPPPPVAGEPLRRGSRTRERRTRRLGVASWRGPSRAAWGGGVGRVRGRVTGWAGRGVSVGGGVGVGQGGDGLLRMDRCLRIDARPAGRRGMPCARSGGRLSAGSRGMESEGRRDVWRRGDTGRRAEAGGFRVERGRACVRACARRC